jgi:hypothetical protein
METSFILKDLKKTSTYQAQLIKGYAEGNPISGKIMNLQINLIQEIRPQLVSELFCLIKHGNGSLPQTTTHNAGSEFGLFVAGFTVAAKVF